jgi:aconitate hydratase
MLVHRIHVDRRGADKEERKTLSFTLIVTFLNVLMEIKHIGFQVPPELVTAIAIAGDLSFNPLTDTLINEDGEEVMLERQQVTSCRPKMDLMKTKVFRASR